MKQLFITALCTFSIMLLATTAFGEDTNLRATLGANATGWTIEVKINGMPIPGITGGSAQAVQLFHKTHPYAKEFKENNTRIIKNIFSIVISLVTHNGFVYG